jgi:hypothetical protein
MLFSAFLAMFNISIFGQLICRRISDCRCLSHCHFRATHLPTHIISTTHITLPFLGDTPNSQRWKKWHSSDMIKSISIWKWVAMESLKKLLGLAMAYPTTCRTANPETVCQPFQRWSARWLAGRQPPSTPSDTPRCPPTDMIKIQEEDEKTFLYFFVFLVAKAKSNFIPLQRRT